VSVNDSKIKSYCLFPQSFSSAKIQIVLQFSFKFRDFLNLRACKNDNFLFITNKNHILWNKNHIPPSRKPRGFSRQSYRSLTGKRQRHSERITCRWPLQWPQLLWMWFLNVWDNVPMDLKYVCQQCFTCTCMCLLGFIGIIKHS
jgi:hypothetical protein